MKLNLTLCAAALAIAAVAQPASAAITISVAPGTMPYSGPTPTFDFETATPQATGGTIAPGSVPGIRAQPFGSTGNYWSIAPADGPGLLDLSAYGALNSISFIWGSIDTYNTLEVLDAANGVLAVFTGSDANNPANGNQTLPASNALVTLLLTGAEVNTATRLRLSSTQNAFEVDNFAINAVPEPGTWAMMLLGFAGIGLSMRRKRSSAHLPALA